MDKIKTRSLEKNMNNLFKNSDISYYYIINSGCLKYNIIGTITIAQNKKE